MLIVGDDGEQHFQSSGMTSKYNNLPKNSQKIRKKIKRMVYKQHFLFKKRLVLIVGYNVATFFRVQCLFSNMGRLAFLDEK